MAKEKDISANFSLRGVDEANEQVKRLNNTIDKTTDSINRLKQSTVDLTDQEKEKLKRQVEEYEDTVILSRLIGAGGEKIGEKALEKGAESAINKILQRAGEKTIGLGNPLLTAEEMMRSGGEFYKLLVTDLKGEYKSVRDDTEFRTLEGLIKYEKEYLAIEQKKIKALTDDFEKTIANTKSDIYKKWGDERAYNYKKRDKINDRYQEENSPNFISNAIKGALGIFPMDTKQKASGLKEITDKRLLSDKKWQGELDWINGIYNNYKASNPPDIAITNRGSENKGSTQQQTPMEVALPEVLVTSPNLQKPQLAEAESSSDIFEKNLKKKEESLQHFAEVNKKIQDDVTDTTEKASEKRTEAVDKENKVTLASVQELFDNIAKHTEMVMMGVNAIFDSINLDMQYKLEEAQERYDAINEKHAEVADRVQESNDKLQSLHEEAKNAQGGRLAVIQEEIAREIEVRNELAAEEKRLAAEKEKAEKEKEQLERQQRKNELKIQIIQAIANVAQGITKALGMGPIIGPILAAVVGAAGAIQIATMSKQLSKMEDGGLLRGNSHARGGMRIQGTNIEVEGGEYVINRRSTQENLGLVSYINSQRRRLHSDDLDRYFSSAGRAYSPSFRTMFAEGGQLPAGSALDTYGDNAVLRAIEAINLQPVVSVVDIVEAQQNVTHLTEWTNLR